MSRISTPSLRGSLTSGPALLVHWLMLLLITSFGAATADDEHDRREEVRIPVGSDVSVDVEIMSGSIEIRGWDEPEVRIRTSDGELEALDIDSGSDWVSVRGTHPGVGWLRIPIPSGEVDLRVDVPKGSSIKAKTINGSIEARGVEGRVSFHAANGRIEVRGAPREAQLETLNSDIEFDGEGSRVDARTLNGTIDLKGVADEVVVHTMSGSVRVEGDVVERVDLRSLAGSIDLDVALAPGARVKCKSYSGSISVSLPEDTSAEFDVQSFSGRIRNELGSRSVSSWRGGPGQRLDFETGEGDGQVTIDTFSGRVRIRSRD